jgi:hypothetical protein
VDWPARPEQHRITLAVTGAGGTRLAAGERVSHIDLMVSANGRKAAGVRAGGGRGRRPGPGATVPQSLQQMDDEFVLRLLGFIGLDQPDHHEWEPGGSAAAQDRAGRSQPVP